MYVKDEVYRIKTISLQCLTIKKLTSKGYSLKEELRIAMLQAEFRILNDTEERAALFVYNKKANLSAVCRELGCNYDKAYRKLKSLRETGGFRKNGRPALVPNVVDNLIKRYVGKEQRSGHSVTIDQLRTKLQKEHSHALLTAPIQPSKPPPQVLRSNYVYEYIRRVGIDTKPPVEAEAPRVEHATLGNLKFFFENTLTADFVEGVPSFLWFNADESHCEIGKPRVVCTVGASSRAQKIDDFPNALHITAMVTINAMGDPIKPLLILTKKNMPNEALPFVVSNRVDISGSSNGWMTDEIFVEWAHNFIARVEEIRQQYNCDPTRRAILILDGHTSRNQIEIMREFKQHYIDVVILPSHLTHLLQPFDVVIGRPFKQKLAAFAAVIHSLIEEEDHTKSAVVRVEQIIAIIDGLQAATTISNCMQAFASCGYVPYDPSVVLKNKDISKSSHVFDDFSDLNTKGFKISGKCITRDDVIDNLKPKKEKRSPRKEKNCK